MEKLTKEQEQFIFHNYPRKGGIFCAFKLNISAKAVRKKASRLKLRILPSTKSKIQREIALKKPPKPFDKYRVNPGQFLSPQSKEAAYILGLLWADGYLFRKGCKISIELKIHDLLNIKPIFDSTGYWRFSRRRRKGRSEQGTLLTTNRPLFNFLNSHNYTSKTKSPNLLINSLTPELRNYWFRGFLDGDGCFYKGKSSNQLAFAGPYSQHWDFVEKIFDSLQIKYAIKRHRSKKGYKYSHIRVSNLDGILKFGNYIYPNCQFDSIGLNRKFKKFTLFLSPASCRHPL